MAPGATQVFDPYRFWHFARARARARRVFFRDASVRQRFSFARRSRSCCAVSGSVVRDGADD